MRTLGDTVQLAKAANEIGYFAAALGALGVGFSKVRFELSSEAALSWGVLACSLAWGAILSMDAWTWKVLTENLELRGNTTFSRRLLGWLALTIGASISSVGFLASSESSRLGGFVLALCVYCASIVLFWREMRRAHDAGDAELTTTLELSWDADYRGLYGETMLWYPLFGLFFLLALLVEALVGPVAAWWCLAALLVAGAIKYFRQVIGSARSTRALQERPRGQ